MIVTTIAVPAFAAHQIRSGWAITAPAGRRERFLSVEAARNLERQRGHWSTLRSPQKLGRSSA
jgi:hypothetical protein